MRIESPLPQPYEVDDYSFTFANGLVMPITVAKELGDTIDWDTTPMSVKFQIASKPSHINPDVSLPPGELTILMQHVIMVEHRTRTIQPPSREEKDLFQQTLHKMGGSIN